MYWLWSTKYFLVIHTTIYNNNGWCHSDLILRTVHIVPEKKFHIYFHFRSRGSHIEFWCAVLSISLVRLFLQRLNNPPFVCVWYLTFTDIKHNHIACSKYVASANHAQCNESSWKHERKIYLYIQLLFIYFLRCVFPFQQFWSKCYICLLSSKCSVFYSYAYLY